MMLATKLAVEVDRLRRLIARFRAATAAAERHYELQNAACMRADLLLDKEAAFAHCRRWEARGDRMTARRGKAELALGRAVIKAAGVIPPDFCASSGYYAGDETTLPPACLRLDGRLVLLEWHDRGGERGARETQFHVKFVDLRGVRTL